MSKAQWDEVACSFEDEIFNVLQNDHSGLVAGMIEKYGSREYKATDIGCGVGRFLETLSGHFKQVLAVDISPKCIEVAKAENANRSNIKYLALDLAAPGARLPRADFALSVNTMIMPSLQQRERILDLMARHLKPGAHLVLVVPSLESALLTDFRLIEWNLCRGMKPATAARSGFRTKPPAEARRIREGVVWIEDQPTKHYLKEELAALLERRRLTMVEAHKLEYSWDTEFDDPPSWMNGPYPWDWLVVAQKRAVS